MFDIILVDLVMKNMSGLDAVLRLRQWEVENQCDPTPALAVTGSIMKPERDQCYAHGLQVWPCLRPRAAAARAGAPGPPGAVRVAPPSDHLLTIFDR